MAYVLEDLKLQFDEKKIASEIRENAAEGERTRVLAVKMPCGRHHREVTVPENDSLPEVLASQISSYRLIEGYGAIWSQELNVIECKLESSYRIPSRIIFNRLRRVLGLPDVKPPETGTIALPPSESGITVSIGTPSVENSVLTGTLFRGNDLVIRIEGVKLAGHDQARSLLQRAGNSALFQLDLITDWPLHLAQERSASSDVARRRVERPRVSPKAPTFEYDQEAMSLYWYARMAYEMPLLQFLAFYQVLEFYFPVYSERAAQQTIRNLIKSPTFNPDHAPDVARVLHTIKETTAGQGYGNERSQLLATLSACVTRDELKDFLEEYPDRGKFHPSDAASRISKHKVVPKDGIKPETDLITLIGDRIYNIRCRIVHSKADHQLEMLLPFSEEANFLDHDIELVEFLARKALIAGSRSLHLH